MLLLWLDKQWLVVNICSLVTSSIPLPLLTNMVQLKPEIYKMIVESMLATEGPFDHNTKLDQQQSLARMMQASKVSSHSFLFTIFFEECRPGLRQVWKGKSRCQETLHSGRDVDELGSGSR
jgi:hypothetical protein